MKTISSFSRMILATALIVILSGGFMSHVFVNGNQGQDQNSIQSYLKRFFGFEEDSLSSGDRDKVSSNVIETIALFIIFGLAC